MYSYEIQEKLVQQDYTLTSKEYLEICASSPQISQIKYYSFGDYFEIWTKDNYYWKFTVKSLENY